jgi:hypothetical protein
MDAEIFGRGFLSGEEAVDRRGEFADRFMVGDSFSEAFRVAPISEFSLGVDFGRFPFPEATGVFFVRRGDPCFTLVFDYLVHDSRVGFYLLDRESDVRDEIAEGRLGG